MQERNILPLAEDSDLLDQRIAENLQGQQIDLAEWIFTRLQVQSGAKILELCCGTGSQTLRFLGLVGKSGQVVALDVAGDALEKLQKKAGPDLSRRLLTVETRMEEFPEALAKLQFQPPAFDLVFCAYGLYYSSNPSETLNAARHWLRPEGKIVVVGPYRDNNGPLFALLREAGVEIPPLVLFTSQGFMEDTVIPWAIGHFNRVTFNTMINHIFWDTPQRLITYWKNTTFYEGKKLRSVKKRVNDFFGEKPVFINEKWVMMVQMGND